MYMASHQSSTSPRIIAFVLIPAILVPKRCNVMAHALENANGGVLAHPEIGYMSSRNKVPTLPTAPLSLTPISEKASVVLRYCGWKMLLIQV